MPQFACEEWVESLKSEINAVPELEVLGKGFSATIQFVAQDADNENPLPFWIKVKDGKVIDFATGQCEKSDFLVSGRREVWERVASGNIDPLQALMAKELSFEGNKAAATKNVKALGLMMETIRKIPTEFE